MLEGANRIADLPGLAVLVGQLHPDTDRSVAFPGPVTRTRDRGWLITFGLYALAQALQPTVKTGPANRFESHRMGRPDAYRQLEGAEDAGEPRTIYAPPMEQLLSFVMLFFGGIFAGTILAVAIISIPKWKRSTPGAFMDDFGQVVKRVDVLQPLLLVITLISAAIYAINTSGPARLFSAIAAVGLLLTLILSVAILVPLQNKIMASPPSAASLEKMRRTWNQGHTGRTVVAIAIFACIVLAEIV